MGESAARPPLPRGIELHNVQIELLDKQSKLNGASKIRTPHGHASAPTKKNAAPSPATPCVQARFPRRPRRSGGAAVRCTTSTASRPVESVAPELHPAMEVAPPLLTFFSLNRYVMGTCCQSQGEANAHWAVRYLKCTFSPLPFFSHRVYVSPVGYSYITLQYRPYMHFTYT
jgi:hypothetical protein